MSDIDKLIAEAEAQAKHLEDVAASNIGLWAHERCVLAAALQRRLIAALRAERERAWRAEQRLKGIDEADMGEIRSLNDLLTAAEFRYENQLRRATEAEAQVAKLRAALALYVGADECRCADMVDEQATVPFSPCHYCTGRAALAPQDKP